MEGMSSKAAPLLLARIGRIPPLVLDGLRRTTLEIALRIYQSVTDAIRPGALRRRPVNKQWTVAGEIHDQDRIFNPARLAGHRASSAKTGQGVEEAFTTLARALAQTTKPASRAD